jgi:hypothetical protein
MAWILLNVPLAVLMLAFTVGLPLWVMFKHPEENRPVPVSREVLRPVRHAPGPTPGRVARPYRANPEPA